MSEDITKRIERVEKKLDTLQKSMDELNVKLSKHIEFIDKTYEGLRNPINAAKRFLGR
jgi:chaperonin cofactor prefoldin|tara:strand:+ start:202 stop:375 length:174 start_codon:yes stop_codon:yes gene_type:complete